MNRATSSRLLWYLCQQWYDIFSKDPEAGKSKKTALQSGATVVIIDVKVENFVDEIEPAASLPMKEKMKTLMIIPTS